MGTVHGIAKESDVTTWLDNNNNNEKKSSYLVVEFAEIDSMIISLLTWVMNFIDYMYLGCM